MTISAWAGNLEVDGVAFHHLDVLAENAGAVFELVEILVPARPVRHDLVDRVHADRERHRHRLVLGDVFEVVRVVMPRSHPEGRLLRIVGHHHPDDGFVPDAGLGILGDGEPGAEIAPAVADRMLRDRQLVEVHLLAEHLVFLDRPVRHHHRLAALGRHALGEVGADPLGVVEPKRRRLAVAVLDQDVGQPPAGIAGEVVERQRPAALRAEIADLARRIDRLADMQHPVVDRFEKRPQAVRHGELPGGWFRLEFVCRRTSWRAQSRAVPSFRPEPTEGRRSGEISQP